MRRFLRTLLAVSVTAVGATVPVGAAAAAAPGDNCAEPGQAIAPVPWQQQLLNPERIWPFARGGGVTVAVLGSGVDAEHPQLRNRVESGFDAVAGGGGANSDCLGVGTQVAGVIAARQATSVAFAGLAPDATILPVRVLPDRQLGPAVVEPAVMTRAINAAVDRGADVIAVPVVSYSGSDAMRAAVERAVTKGVVVVAAAGDLGDVNGGNPVSYPAAYDGVIGVGAITRSGDRWMRSQYGNYVDLVAPGADIVTLQRGRGQTVAEGTGLACGFVAGAVALAKAKRRDLDVAELTRLLFATASPTPAGPAYGHGIVDPYAAVNDQVSKASPTPLPALVRPASEGTSAWARSRDFALVGALVAVLAVLVVLVVAIALPRGRRRLWRATIAAAPPHRAGPEEPGPPVLLFDDQPAG
ncbi:hypothetical protein GCM10027290_66590 [Micromonospora sonneratiae]|uniref:S8 family serine peptidase n=1 Tax=Micromonospora sonneratiae TaxID=1184706 RepID=A0ABW3YLV8_9ACTN